MHYHRINTILLGVSSVPEVTSIPTESQEEFIKAQEYLDYVNEKQIGN